MDLQPTYLQKSSSLLPSHFSIVKRENYCALSFLLLLAIVVLVDPLRRGSLVPTAVFPRPLDPPASSPCDYTVGRWVRDDVGPLRPYPESCRFLDPGFRCRENGRRDEDYLRWRWQPDGCDLPGFNASDLLERSRNGRIVFAGDSLGRNQWESLVCLLAQAVRGQTAIHELNGSPIARHNGFLAMRFPDHNLTVEYYRTPFLAAAGRPPPNSSVRVRMAVRVDRLHGYARRWVGADVLVFNAGHWWNLDKTLNTGTYFQEGGAVNMSMGVMEAFRRSLLTWEAWVSRNLDPERAHVFFRSYSPVHYRGGAWDSGGRCDFETSPETDPGTVEGEPEYNGVVSEVLKRMESSGRNVGVLNISYLSYLRADGHPSVHREPGTPAPVLQDCSHWCLPGVPDTWNQLLYAGLKLQGFRTPRHNFTNPETGSV